MLKLGTIACGGLWRPQIRNQGKFPTRGRRRLPLLEVDWELVSDQEFRGLLAALEF